MYHTSNFFIQRIVRSFPFCSSKMLNEKKMIGENILPEHCFAHWFPIATFTGPEIKRPYIYNSAVHQKMFVGFSAYQYSIRTLSANDVTCTELNLLYFEQIEYLSSEIFAIWTVQVGWGWHLL